MNMGAVRQIIMARRKTVVLVAMLALLDLGLYLFYALYQVPRLQALQDGVFVARRALSSGLPQDAETVYRQGLADLTEWNKRIPPKREFARFLGDLFDLARKNALSVGGITYRPSLPKEGGALTYILSLNVSGKYGQVKSFIADLSRIRDIATIDTVSLNSSKLTEEFVNMKVDVTAYFRTEGK